MTNIYAFLKFGQVHNIKELYHNGIVFMNSIEYFRRLDDNGIRGDSYEGINNIINFPSGKFSIPSINYEGTFKSFHIKGAYEESYGNIYSMYCISSNGWKTPAEFYIDPRVRKFGSSCLMIKRTDVFLNRVTKELNRLNLKFRHGFISYYNKQQINRSVHVFEKPNEFEYQKEFRIYIQREASDSIILNIGSLEDISEIFKTSSIVEELRLYGQK